MSMSILHNPKKSVNNLPKNVGTGVRRARARAQAGTTTPPLGNICEIVVQKHIEASKNNHLPEPVTFEENRKKRYDLLKIARGILNNTRLAACHRKRIKEKVEIWKTPEGRHYFGGLVTCGSVWTCPVCAPKITEKRRLELNKILESVRFAGLQIQMVTLTASHTITDSLHDVLSKIIKAEKHLKNSRTWREYTGSSLGSVRSLEVTHGDNSGWHPHIHLLLIGEHLNDVLFDGTERRFYWLDGLKLQWQKSCARYGLTASIERGLTVQGAHDAAGYVAKWGIDYELTKGHVKEGREGRNSSFDLLRLYETSKEKKYAVLFREYAREFKGRRQLTFSPGLRVLFGLGEEKTDEALAVETDNNSELVESLESVEWIYIIRHNMQAYLLDCADRSLETFLNALERIRAQITPDDLQWGSLRDFITRKKGG